MAGFFGYLTNLSQLNEIALFQQTVLKALEGIQDALSNLNIEMDTDDASEIEQTAKRIREAFVAFDGQLQDQGKRILQRFEMHKFRESNESLFGY